MKWIKWTLALLCTAPLLQANVQYSIGAEALYWLPLKCELDWAYTSGTFGVALPDRLEVFSISPNYDWGFRVNGWAACGRCYGGASYLWYEADHTQCVERPFLVIEGVASQTEIFGRGRARLKERYQNADLRFGRVLYNRCHSWAGAFVNLRWSDIKETIFVEGLDGNSVPNISHDHRPKFWGIGPGLGAEGRWAVWDCYGNLGIFGSINGMALIGERRVSHDELINTDQSIIVHWERSDTVVPALDGSIGINYFYHCNCWWISLAVGYEINYLFEALVLSDNDRPAVSEGIRRNCRDIGFAGIILGVQAGF